MVFSSITFLLYFFPLVWIVYRFVPVGISFYTFQALSYVVDVYREKVKPRQDLLSFVCRCPTWTPQNSAW
ncbi:MAG: hypothetical protein IJU49_07080 [Lachnospiraceae bacterium]|nr:hypothetical protein [Lachnospiraceae bacterium]